MVQSSTLAVSMSVWELELYPMSVKEYKLDNGCRVCLISDFTEIHKHFLTFLSPKAIWPLPPDLYVVTFVLWTPVVDFTLCSYNMQLKTQDFEHISLQQCYQHCAIFRIQWHNLFAVNYHRFTYELHASSKLKRLGSDSRFSCFAKFSDY